MSPDIKIVAKIKAIFGLMSSSLRVRPKPVPSLRPILLFMFSSKPCIHFEATRRNTFSGRCSVVCSYSLTPEDMTTEVSWIKQQTARRNGLAPAIFCLYILFCLSIYVF